MRRETEPEGLIACWSLVEGDAALVGDETGATRLGLRPPPEVLRAGRSLPPPCGERPGSAVKYVAQQVEGRPRGPCHLRLVRTGDQIPPGPGCELSEATPGPYFR